MMLDMATYAPVLAALVVIGLLAGFLAGLLGVGGGIVLVPAFFYAFRALGFDGPGLMQICLATSLATIVVTSLRSLQSHNAKGAVDWAILRGWAAWIALGAVVGVVTAAGLGSVVLQCIFGALGAGIGLYLAFGRSDWALANALPKGVLRAVFAPILGFLSVLLGIGGGSLGVPLMTLHRVPIHNAVATASGFGLAISVPSVIGWLFVDVDAPHIPLTFGAINLPAFLIIIPLTFLMAPVGARVAHQSDARVLKRVFGVFLMIVAANMIRAVIWG